MNRSIKYLSLCFIAATLIFVACKKEAEVEEIIKGCTDITADNYNANAKESDGSCTYQKRFVGTYDVKVACGLTSELFTDAKMELKSISDKKKVEFVISTSNVNINFYGNIIGKDSIKVDTLITDFQVDLNKLSPLIFTTTQITKVDMMINSKFFYEIDIKKLSGPMLLNLVTKEEIIFQGVPLAPGRKFEDTCELNATKK